MVKEKDVLKCDKGMHAIRLGPRCLAVVSPQGKRKQINLFTASGGSGHQYSADSYCFFYDTLVFCESGKWYYIYAENGSAVYLGESCKHGIFFRKREDNSTVYSYFKYGKRNRGECVNYTFAEGNDTQKCDYYFIAYQNEKSVDIFTIFKDTAEISVTDLKERSEKNDYFSLPGGTGEIILFNFNGETFDIIYQGNDQDNIANAIVEITDAERNIGRLWLLNDIENEAPGLKLLAEGIISVCNNEEISIDGKTWSIDEEDAINEIPDDEAEVLARQEEKRRIKEEEERIKNESLEHECKKAEQYTNLDCRNQKSLKFTWLSKIFRK